MCSAPGLKHIHFLCPAFRVQKPSFTPAAPPQTHTWQPCRLLQHQPRLLPSLWTDRPVPRTSPCLLHWQHPYYMFCTGQNSKTDATSSSWMGWRGYSKCSQSLCVSAFFGRLVSQGCSGKAPSLPGPNCFAEELTSHVWLYREPKETKLF